MELGSKVEVMERQLVQRSVVTWKEFNEEEHMGFFYEPVYAYKLIMENCKKGGIALCSYTSNRESYVLTARLQNYFKMLDIMDYACDISSHLTILQIRMAKNNVSNPTNLWRWSKNESMENILKELETLAKAYFQLIDDMTENKEWVKKIEEELGQNFAFTLLQIDETSRNSLIEVSPVFLRFEEEKSKYFR